MRETPEYQIDREMRIETHVRLANLLTFRALRGVPKSTLVGYIGKIQHKMGHILKKWMKPPKNQGEKDNVAMMWN